MESPQLVLLLPLFPLVCNAGIKDLFQYQDRLRVRTVTARSGEYWETATNTMSCYSTDRIQISKDDRTDPRVVRRQNFNYYYVVTVHTKEVTGTIPNYQPIAYFLAGNCENLAGSVSAYYSNAVEVVIGGQNYRYQPREGTFQAATTQFRPIEWSYKGVIHVSASYVSPATSDQLTLNTPFYYPYTMDANTS